MRRGTAFLCCATVLALMGAVAFAAGPDGAEPGWPVDLTQTTTPPHQSLTWDPPSTGCVLADLQTTATASRSGGGSGTTYGPELANNGVFGPGNNPTCNPCVSGGCWHWTSCPNSYASSTCWYQLRWPAPVQICQIWVDTKPPATECGCGAGRLLSGGDIQTSNDGVTWTTHSTILGRLDDWGYTFPTCQTTQYLRINKMYVDPAAGGQTSNPCIYEFKVYGCGAPPGQCDLRPIEAKLDSIEPKVDDIGTKVDTLEGKSDAMQGQMNTLEDKIDAIPCDVLNKVLPFFPGHASLPSTHPCYVPPPPPPAPTGPRMRAE